MSEPAPTSWKPTRAGAVASGRGGNANGEAGVRLTLMDTVPLLTLIARHGQVSALAPLVLAHTECDLPPAGKAGFWQGGAIVWSAPGQWLIVGDARGLKEAAVGLAACTDQTSSRALIEIAGPAARDTLAKGFAIDLHPSVFAPGTTAVTGVAHMSVQIWQIDETPRFVVAVPRSLFDSFWSWLTQAAAPFGYDVL